MDSLIWYTGIFRIKSGILESSQESRNPAKIPKDSESRRRKFIVSGPSSCIEVMRKAWLRAMTSFFLVIYRVSSWNEWLRAGALYGNLTCDAVLAFLGQICALVQQTD